MTDEAVERWTREGSAPSTEQRQVYRPTRSSGRQGGKYSIAGIPRVAEERAVACLV